MSRGSVFARAIGLTKSLSGLTFERDEPVENMAGGGDHESVAASETIAPSADDTAPAKIDAIAAEAPDSEVAAVVAGTASNENGAPESAAPLAEEIALSTVTIVPAETTDAEETEAEVAETAAAEEDAPVPILAGTTFDETATPVEMAAGGETSAVEAIDPIAADIASLLASLDSVRHDGEPQVPAAAAAAHDEDEEDAEDATIVLLGELNRLWLARRSRSPAYLR